MGTSADSSQPLRGLPTDARAVVVLVARLVAVMIAAGWGSELLKTAIGFDGWTSAALAPLAVLVLAAPAVLVLVLLPARRLLHASEQARVQREEELRAQSDRQEFDATLRRAFELARDEAAAMEVVARAGEILSPDAPVELLLADSSEAHLRRAVGSEGGESDGCQVAEPWSCPAMASGRMRAFGSSADLDTCPSLRHHPGGDRSALCVPVNFLGRALGVLHRAGEPDVEPDEETVQRMRLLGGQTGATLGMLRALARSQMQAATDSLTGLLNRRSLLEQVRLVEGTGRRYAVLMLDLDHFKALNDLHGHESGDRALRTFAKVLRDSVRDGDLVGRYGGEEFLVVLPDQDCALASSVAERVRTALDAALRGTADPGFTTSIGVADSTAGVPFEDVVRLADAALFEAKHRGRDQVRVTSAPVPSVPDQRRSTEGEAAFEVDLLP